MIPYNLGILYYSAHAALNAERAWQEALHLDSAMGNAHLNLSFLYYELGQYQSAWDHCQRARQLGTVVSFDLENEIQKKILSREHDPSSSSHSLKEESLFLKVVGIITTILA